MPEKFNPDSVIGLYRKDISSDKRLCKTTVARQDLVDEIIQKLKNSKNSTQHFVFIGPRGIGKTHLLSLIEFEVNSTPELSNKYVPIRFPEENNRILSFADFLIGIVEILSVVNIDSQCLGLFEAINEEQDDDIITDTILPRLSQFHKTTGKKLLIFVENLDALFSQQMKNSKSIHQLRKFLMDNPIAVFVGTSPIYFKGFNDIKHPLYDFFDIQVIRDLTEEETIELIRLNLEYDQFEDQIHIFEQLKPKITALHIMTGGNPRLILMLYGLITKDNILDVKIQFQQLLDKVTPFYQDRIKDLQPQQRALLETMALMRSARVPRTPGNIARKMRKSPGHISTLLQRMVQSGYLLIAINPNDKRSKLYRIKEGFFDLWLAMNQSRLHRKRFPFLVEFFERWYSDKKERERKRCDLRATTKEYTDERSNQITDEITGYLSDLGSRDEQVQTKIEIALEKLKHGDIEYSTKMLTELKPLAGDSKLFAWMTDKLGLWQSEGIEKDIYQQFEEMIDYWRKYRSGDLEDAAQIAQQLSYDFTRSGLHQINELFLTDALEKTESESQKIPLLLRMASSQKIDGRYNASLQTLDDTLKLCRDFNDRKNESITLNNISLVYQARGDYDKALKYLEDSLIISQGIGDRAGEGTTLNNFSQVYQARGDYDKALKYLEDSLIISQEIGNRAVECATLNNISLVYQARGDYDKALKYLEESLIISQEIGNRAGEGTTLNNFSQVYHTRGDYDKALKYLEDSLIISQEIGDRAGEGMTLNNISQVYKAQRDYKKALKYLEESLKIRQEIGDRAGEGTTLNNISQIFDARGDYKKALKYLEESLKISQEIGDRAGMCATLFNLGHIHWTKKEQQQAVRAWVTVFVIAKQIGEAQALKELDNLAKYFGQKGIEFWEKLAEDFNIKK